MSDIHAEIKRLIRFDPKTAIERSKEEVKTLAKKLSDSTDSTIKLEQLMSDAQLLKWCTKALMYEYDGIFALNEIKPVIDSLSACSKKCTSEAKDDESQKLLRAQVQAILMYSSGILLQMVKPQEALQAIEKLTELRNAVAPSDFILMKYNLKLMTGYFPQREESLAIALEQVELKKVCDAASELNSEIISKHGYKKFNPHLDYMKLTSIEGFFDIDDYNKLQRQYTTGKDCDPVWAVRVRINACKRFEDLKEYDAQNKHYRIISTLLDDGKYKSIPFGIQLRVAFMKKKLQFAVKLKKYEEAKAQLELFKEALVELGCLDTPIIKLCIICMQRNLTDKSETELHKKMYEDYISTFGTILEFYEKSNNRQLPFTTIMELLTSMFELNDNAEEIEG